MLVPSTTGKSGVENRVATQLSMMPAEMRPAGFRRIVRRSLGQMEVAQLFFSRYEDLRSAMEGLVACPEAEWRARPHGLNPITWLIWHMARAEDSGLNRLVFDRPQVLDDPLAQWPSRMGIAHRHHGSTMPSDEVDALNTQADIGALWAYSVAVAERTRALVGQLDPA